MNGLALQGYKVIRKLHVAVDLDDVTLDFMQSVFATFAREYGEHLPFDRQPWGEEAQTIYKHPLLLESGYKSWWDWLRDREWLWATFPAVDGAIGGIKRLRAAGHYVECVTSKPEWAEHNVWKWLGRWRPAFNQVTIVGTGQRKLDFTRADVIVDDKLETCVEFTAAGRRAILFDRSRKQVPPRGCMVAWHWEHVVELIAELEEDARGRVSAT